jgi:hypothetical protein
MDLNTMRMIVTANMPYDTGFMFLAGSKYFENEHYQMCVYDTERVPYIVYNEEGTIYTQVNKGFISQKTIGALNQYGIEEQCDIKRPISPGWVDDTVKRRASTNMIKQGALDKIGVEMK